MNKAFYCKLLILFFFLQMMGTAAIAQNDKTAWFEDGRYGMFIHWGLYSAAEGLWEGERLRYVNNYAEWIRYRNRISREDYGKLADRFVWDKIDPEQWVILAKEAGMKYIIITSKHHDGVAIWDTKVNDYSLTKLAGVDRDIIKEMADACRKHGIKLGFYYSHWIDWEHPFGWDHNMEIKGRVSDEQFDQYWQEKVIPQVSELLTDYGDIAIMWFDMWIPYQQSIIKEEQLVQLAKLIRKLQPDCLINSRLGLSPESEYVDFETLPDNVFGTRFIPRPWETPGTIEHSWGFNSQDKTFKSVSQLFESLVGNVNLNGGLTLNIGPRADGTVPYESTSRLHVLGDWLKTYGEAVYDNTGLGFRSGGFDWGKATYNKKNKNVYLHVFNRPLDDTLRVTGIGGKIERIELMTGEETSLSLEYFQSGPVLHIAMPQEMPDPFNSVVRIVAPKMQLEKDIVPESSFGGFSLNSVNAMNNDISNIVRYNGKTPTYTKVRNQSLEWQVYLPRPGRYSVSVSAHNPGSENIPVLVTIGNKMVSALLHPDGKVVAEPNENNYTDEFVERHAGTFVINRPQLLKVRFKVLAKEEIWLNYVWMERDMSDELR